MMYFDSDSQKCVHNKTTRYGAKYKAFCMPVVIEMGKGRIENKG